MLLSGLARSSAGREAHVAGVRRAREGVGRAGDGARPPHRSPPAPRCRARGPSGRPRATSRGGSSAGSRARGRGHQRGQPLAQVGEDRLQLGGAGARLELVEQGVVGLVADADRLGLAALELDHAPQGPGEGGEVVGLPRLDPRRDAARAGLGDLAHQRLGHAQRPVAARGAPGAASRGRRRRARRPSAQRVDRLARRRRGPARGGAGRRACRAAAPAPSAPARRHQRLAVPAEQRRRCPARSARVPVQPANSVPLG